MEVRRLATDPRRRYQNHKRSEKKGSPVKKWIYKVTGIDAEGQTWRVTGSLAAFDVHNAISEAFKLSFFQLTDGKAEFGSPGKGCRGPYKVDGLSVTQDHLTN